MVKNWGGAGDHQHRWGDGYWYPCRVPLLHPETWGISKNDSLGRGSSVHVDIRMDSRLQVKLPDAVTMLVEGIAIEVMGCAIKIEGLMVRIGRGVGKYKGGVESTQMGVGGSFSWDSGWTFLIFFRILFH